MSKFFKDLKKGLEDIVAYKKGKLKLRSEVIEVSVLSLKCKRKKDKKS